MIKDVDELQAEWSYRQNFYTQDHLIMDKLVGVYYGILPPEYDDFFDAEMHVHIINMIRMAWDDLAIRAGKVFPVYVLPDNDKPTARERAEKQERIACGYNYAGRTCGSISRKLLQQVQAWWMVGTANAVTMVLPDYERKTPYFTFRDPRMYYPSPGWTPYTQAAPDDALFAYQLPLAEIKRRYPDKAGEIAQKIESRAMNLSVGPKGSTASDSSLVWIGEYYTADTWMVATLTDRSVLLVRSDTGDKGHPDVMPVVSMGLYTPGGAKGRSMFADQISIQAAMARMFSQKLDFYDRTLYPLVFHTSLLGKTIKVGPYATNEFDVSDGNPPKVEVISPAHQIDADATMAFAMGLSRMLNRNPESFQGQGQAVSSKAITQLESGVTSTIRDGIWPPMLEADPKLYEIAAKMDVALWGNERKAVEGKLRNNPFRMNYVPTVDLRDREGDFKVKAGYGLAGYQGVLEILQLLGAEQIAEETALEEREDVENADQELRRINADRIKKLQRLELATRAQAQPGMPGSLQPGALAELLSRIEGGDDIYEAMAEMDKAGILVVPQPTMPPGMPPGAPGAGGAPALTGIGGPAAGMSPAASFLPMPTMEALRGGPGGTRPAGPRP